MAIFKPKYFAKDLDSFAKEVLPSSVYNKHGVKGLRKMDQDLLEFLDEFRYDCCVSLTVNTPWNGAFDQSGYRTAEHYGASMKYFMGSDKEAREELRSYQDYVKSLSDHLTGRALDIKSGKLTGNGLRLKFIEREQYYFERYGINFIEVGPLNSKGNSMSWFHVGKRLDLGQGIQYWSPVLGFVSKERVLEEGL
jgi:hypothetical protein